MNSILDWLGDFIGAMPLMVFLGMGIAALIIAFSESQK